MGRPHGYVCAAMLAAGALVSAQSAQTPVRREGSIAVTAQSPALLRSVDLMVDSMRRSGELSVRKVRQDTLMAGRSHERYDQ